MCIKYPLLLAALISSTPAQNLLSTFNSNFRPSGEVPAWLSPVLGTSANINDIEKSYQEYLKLKYGENKPFSHITTEWHQGLEPWYRAYKTWKKIYSTDIDAMGNIDLSKIALNQQPIGQMPKPTIEPPAAPVWQNIGPKKTLNAAFAGLKQTPIPYQSNIYRVRIAPSNPNVVFASGETGHLYKTTDKGMNWVDITMNYAMGGAVEAIGIDPKNENNVIVGAGTYIHRSTDGGVTWSATAIPYAWINEIQFSRQNSNLVWFSSGNGIYRSVDGGATWNSTNSAKCWDIINNPLNDQVVYAACQNSGTSAFQIMKSTNGGLTWSQKTSGIDQSHHSEGVVLGMSAADTNRIFATAIGLGSGNLSMVYSSDRGETWSMGEQGSTQNDLSHFKNWQGFYDLALLVNPQNANQLITGSANVHYSANGGLKLSRNLGGYGGELDLHPDFQDACSEGGDTWVATDGGLIYSPDFFATLSKVEPRMNGVIGSDFWHWDQGWDEDIHVGGRYHNGDILLSEHYPQGTSVFIGGSEAATGWLLHGRPGAFITSDGLKGNAPNSVSGLFSFFDYSKFPGEDGYGEYGSELLINPLNFSHHYVGNGTSLWESTDGGINFRRLVDFGFATRKMEISRPDGKVIYVALEGPNFKRSMDGGKTWSNANFPAGVSGNYVELSINPENANEIWLVNRAVGQDHTDKVFQSLDAGMTWINKTTPTLNGLVMRYVNFIGGSGGDVYLVARGNEQTNGIPTTQARILYKSANSNQWVDYSAGAPRAAINIVGALPFYRDARLRFASNHGIWDAPLVNQNYRPVAQMSLQTTSVNCAKDTVVLYDYSIVRKIQSRKWTITPAPRYISSDTALRPKVVFGGVGTYDISLAVTDDLGQISTQTMNQIFTNTGSVPCEIQNAKGNSLSIPVAGASLNLPASEVTTNHFTLTAWFKIGNKQPADAGLILMRNGVSVNRGIYFQSNNTLGFSWDGFNDLTNSTQIPLNQWNHVAFVVQPDSGKLYLNGQLIMAVRGNFDSKVLSDPWVVGIDPLVSGRETNGMLIDEIQFFNKSMSGQEIINRMSKSADPNESGFISYYQFSELYESQNITDLISQKNTTMYTKNGITRSLENAPINGLGDPTIVNPLVKNSLEVFFNRDNGVNTVHWSTPESGGVKIQVYSVEGKKIVDRTFKESKGSYQLPKGNAAKQVVRIQSTDVMRHFVVLP